MLSLLFTPFPGGILLCELIKGLCNVGEVIYEGAVKVTES